MVKLLSFSKDLNFHRKSLPVELLLWQICELYCLCLQRQKFVVLGDFKMVAIKALHNEEKDAQISRRRVWPFCLLSCENNITSFRSPLYLLPCQLGAWVMNWWQLIQGKVSSCCYDSRVQQQKLAEMVLPSSRQNFSVCDNYQWSALLIGVSKIVLVFHTLEYCGSLYILFQSKVTDFKCLCLW